MNYVSVVAHQGGWDEILVVILPVLIAASLLSLWRRRRQARAEATTGD